MMLGVAMIVTSEAFVLAEKLGLSHQALSTSPVFPRTILVADELLSRGGTDARFAGEQWIQARLHGGAYAKGLAARPGGRRWRRRSTPLGAMAAQLYALYVASGEGGSDFSGVIEMIRGKLRN